MMTETVRLPGTEQRVEVVDKLVVTRMASAKVGETTKPFEYSYTVIMTGGAMRGFKHGG